MFISEEKLDYYRMQYPEGTKLRITSPVEDPYSPKEVGDIFTVNYIDDASNIHGRWKSGGGISLIIGVDDFEVYTEEENCAE